MSQHKFSPNPSSVSISAALRLLDKIGKDLIKKDLAYKRKVDTDRVFESMTKWRRKDCGQSGQ